MLRYERIDISGGINFDKTNESVEFFIIGISKILDLNINEMFVMIFQ